MKKSPILDQMFHDVYGKITAIMFAIDLDEKEMSKNLVEQLSNLLSVYQSIYNESPDEKSMLRLAEKKKIILTIEKNTSKEIFLLCSLSIILFYENTTIKCIDNSLSIENTRMDYLSKNPKIEKEIREIIKDFNTEIHKSEKDNKISIVYKI